MNTEHSSQEKNGEAFIDALLSAAYVDERAAVANRVEKVMRLIEHEKSAQPRPISEHIRATRRMWSRWTSWSIAASLLIAMFIGLQYFTNQKALAAIEQSLAAAAEQITRKYLISVTFREGNTSREIQNDLYVQGNDRFALRHPALLPGTDLWLGKNGDQTWVVPAFGPVLTGNDLTLTRWLSSQDQVSTPYLHVTTVLNRMSHGYQLKELDATTIRTASGTSMVCRHVFGELKNEANQKLPRTIELWADAQTGVAMRIEALWPISALESSREKVVIEFSEQPTLPDKWFEAEGHFSGSRRRIEFDKKEME